MKQRIRNTLYEVIFETDTKAGKNFDLALVGLIILSLIAAMAESVESLRASYPRLLRCVEAGLTVAFSIEYALRVYCARKRRAYIFSFLGIIDLVAILPAALSALFPAAKYLKVFRVVRAIRIFRILKMARYLEEVRTMQDALIRSRRKIAVFIFFVVTLVIIFGTLLYLVEGASNGFTSIPRSVYWAIVTLTTVGYGDISPNTPAGQAIASLIMLLGYSIIAVPTGLVIAEAVDRQRPTSSDGAIRAAGTPGYSNTSCPGCGAPRHDPDALFCKYCGAALDPKAADR
ncbi:MAG TPA: ion transporter [Candidatus Sumerlaeota bacterium]|nr:ion transporter [Candidatus Sumerlaeota bacterium]